MDINKPIVSAPPTDVTSVTSSSTHSAPTSIDDLPNELLSHIFDYLDGPRPSSAALLDEPYFDLTRSSDAPLKSSSLVCKQWREATTPVLFKYACLTAKRNISEDIVEHAMLKPFSDFVHTNHLKNVVRSVVLLTRSSKTTNLSTLSRIEFDLFWPTLFEAIDPTTVLIVAPAEALGEITGCNVAAQDSWNFDCPCHYLQVSRLPKTVPPSIVDENERRLREAHDSEEQKPRQVLPKPSTP